MAFDPEVANKCREHAREVIADRLPLKVLKLEEKEVQVRKSPIDRSKPYEGITIHGAGELSSGGTTVTDNVGYAAQVTWIRSTGDGIRDDAELEAFRSYIYALFHNQKPISQKDPTSVAAVFYCTVEFGRWLLPKMYEDHFDSTSLLIRYWNENERLSQNG